MSEEFIVNIVNGTDTDPQNLSLAKSTFVCLTHIIHFTNASFGDARVIHGSYNQRVRAHEHSRHVDADICALRENVGGNEEPINNHHRDAIASGENTITLTSSISQ